MTTTVLLQRIIYALLALLVVAVVVSAFGLNLG